MNRESGEKGRAGTNRAGLFSAARGILATLLESARTRLELARTELEETGILFARMLAFALVSLACFGLFVIFGVALLTLAFWESRLLVLGLFSALFLALGIVFIVVCLRQKKPEPALSATLSALEEDIRQLKAAAAESSRLHPDE
ncbi:MAG: phage holin family protein [Betaproteobacteria bacterium]|nr:phage holin family protein [Betaproteobacteria bacterium]